MEYDEVIAAAFDPSPPGAAAPPTIDASPLRRLRDAIEPLAMHVVWSKITNERLASLGLDFGTGYVWGRAAALGEPSPGVVVSSFAVFEPDMVSGLYMAGRAACPREAMLDARTSATIASLQQVLDGVDPAQVDRVATALGEAVATLDHTGRPLFAGLRDREVPDDPIGRLWHTCELLREHRGDSHVAVCVQRGLGPVEMNLLTELWVGFPAGTYSASRGWSEEALLEGLETLREVELVDGDQLSEIGREFRDEIEDDTDRLQGELLGALGDDLDEIIGLLGDWSALCIAAGSFPPDVFKRAAG